MATMVGTSTSFITTHTAPLTHSMRKRKAETQNNERLSKRLSLLNLEQNGQKLYVPVESPHLQPMGSPSLDSIPESDSMQLDNLSHKVYIYDLDAELAGDSSGDETSDEARVSSSQAMESGSGRLVFLPDIEKHLRETRIPPSVLANPEGELAGMNMQMVLYSDGPRSLSVSEEKDSVRKAVLEARERVRMRQMAEKEPSSDIPAAPMVAPEVDMSVDGGPFQSALSNVANESTMASTGMGSFQWPVPYPEDDPDAMDLDIN